MVRSSVRSPGFALLAVLWIVVLLGVLAGNVGATAHLAVRSAVGSGERLQAAALAEAGINRAILAILAQADWPVDGTPIPWSFGGTTVQLSVQDQTGLLDLNHASPQALAALFSATGIDTSQAGRLAQAVVDWRDPDDLTADGSSEAGQYEAAGLVQPRNEPFEMVGDLRLVLGMTPDLFDRLDGAVTVLGRRDGPDLTSAPHLILMAQPGATKASIDAALDMRRTAGPPRPRLGGAYSIRAWATGPTGYQFTREAVVRVTGDSRVPYWIHSWRRVGNGTTAPEEGRHG